MRFDSKPFKLRLTKPFKLKRRELYSKDPNFYSSELITCSNSNNQVGLGELVSSRKLAKEMARLDLKSQEKNISILDLMGREIKHKQIPIAAMISSLDQDAILEAENLINQGFETLKFKITSNFKQELEILKIIHNQISPVVKIRLDANQALDLDSAIWFGNQIRDLNIQYFEEPLINPLEIPKLFRETNLNIALDESLLDWAASPEKSLLEGVKYFALKPFLMPNIQSILNWINLAEQNQIQPVICSAFESGLGLNWLARLHASLQKAPAAGLSTYRWFTEDLIKPRFESHNGKVSISEILTKIRF